jgi:hypothetical protein
VRRLEPALIGLFFACWLGVLLVHVGVLDLAGSLPLDFYPYYSLAVACGWFFGIVWVQRSKQLPPSLRRPFALLYLAGPPGFLYLVRALAPVEHQQAAPLVPLLGFGIYGVFFAVPVLLRPRKRG